MYNRYLNDMRPAESDPPAAQTSARQDKTEAGLFGNLSRRIGSFRIDADMLIMLAVIWFVLSESGEEMESELLLAIAVLLLLGV